MELLNRTIAIGTIATALLFGILIATNQTATAALGNHFQQFVADVLIMARYCIGGAAVMACMAGFVYLAIIVSKRHNENMRQRDGSFAMLKTKLHGHTVYIDPNKIVAPALIVGPTGIQEVFTAEPTLHLHHAVARAKVAAAQAIAPGDAAIASRHGSQYRGVRLGGQERRIIDSEPKRGEQYTISTPERLALPAPAPEPVRLLTVNDAITQAQTNRIVIGQSQATGALAVYDPTVHGHAAIIGSTGTGKTTGAAMTAVASAIRAGYHVIILDPDGGSDWGAFRSHAEWMEADRETLPDQINALNREYLRRKDGAGQPLLIVIEEYGDLLAQLHAAKRGDAESVDNALDAILRRGRRRGMHVMLIDQYPEKWSQQVIAGVKWRAVHRLGPNQGAKLEEYKVSQLPARGAFRHDGDVYESWHAAPSVRALLATVPAPNHAPIVDAQWSVISDRSTVPAEATPPFLTPVERQNGTQNGAETGTPGTDDSGRWNAVVDAWFAANPQALLGPAVGVSDLARAMCADAEGADANYAAYKGRAHKLFHEFRNAVRLPGGERLGTDTAKRGNL